MPSEPFRTLTEVEAWGLWSAYDGIDCDSSDGSSIKNGDDDDPFIIIITIFDAASIAAVAIDAVDCSDQGSVASCRTFADNFDNDES